MNEAHAAHFLHLQVAAQPVPRDPLPELQKNIEGVVKSIEGVEKKIIDVENKINDVENSISQVP